MALEVQQGGTQPFPFLIHGGFSLDYESEKPKSEYVPMDFGTVLSNSLSYWMKNLKSFWILYFALHIGFITVGYGILFLSGSNYIVAEIAALLGVIFPDWLIAVIFPNTVTIILIIIIVVIVIINIIIQTLLAGMVVQHTADHHLKRSPILSESLSVSRSQIWSLIGAQILIIVITLGITFGSIGLTALAFAGTFFLFPINPFAILVVGIGVLAGVVLMMILLIYIMTRFAVVIPSIILGKFSAVESIRHSWRLVNGNWWRTFGVSFIIGLLSSALGMPLTIGSMILTFGFVFPSITLLAISIIVIVGAVMTGITAPLGNTTTTMIYHDLMGRQSMEYRPLKPKPYLAETGRVHQHNVCPVCKAPVSASDRFCEKCGRNLTID